MRLANPLPARSKALEKRTNESKAGFAEATVHADARRQVLHRPAAGVALG
jgi:hypothetical protein